MLTNNLISFEQLGPDCTSVQIPKDTSLYGSATEVVEENLVIKFWNYFSYFSIKT